MFLPWSMMAMPDVEGPREIGFWTNRQVAYRDERAVSRALGGVGQRMSRSNPLHQGMLEMQRHRQELVQDFNELWPAMQAFAAEQRDSLREQPAGDG